MTVAYNPANRFEIKSWDTEFRRAPKRTLMARIYQPQGDGPFPVLLDLHDPSKVIGRLTEPLLKPEENERE